MPEGFVESVANRVTVALAAIGSTAAILYVVGGVTLAWQLHNEHLPASAVVWQLPREFLLSVTIKVVGWALLLAILLGTYPAVLVKLASDRWQWAARRRLIIGGSTIAGVALFLAGGAWFESHVSVLQNAVACQKNGGRPVTGKFIGQSGDRTYIGERVREHARVASLPNDQMGFLFVGGDFDATRLDRATKLCKDFAPPATSSGSTTTETKSP
jgi:hypothetical protein